MLDAATGVDRAASNQPLPSIGFDRHGAMTNGIYTIDAVGMKKHESGDLGSRSQFLSNLVGFHIHIATLDAAAYADANNLWKSGTNNSRAKVTFDKYIGVLGRNGEMTKTMNLYRNKNGYVHSSPGTPEE